MTINVAVVGLGKMGISHLGIVNALEDFKVVAICDSSSLVGEVIEKYGKSLILPTHNYAVLAAIDDYALAPGAISIGGHESKANFFANHGVRVQHDDNLLITGGYGLVAGSIL